MKRVFIVLIMLAASVAHADTQLTAPIVDQDYMETYWGIDYSCGARTWTENVAYWDLNGYTNLVEGAPIGGSPDNSQYMIDLYGLSITNSGFTGTYTYPEGLCDGLRSWFASRGYNIEITLSTYPYWRDIVAELDAGRPVPMLIYGANHWVTAIGHTVATPNAPKTLTLLWGHYPYVRVITQAQLLAYWPVTALYVRPGSQLPPDPTTQPWFTEAAAWCAANGYEIERAD